MADNEVIIEVTARLDKAEAAIKKFEDQAKASGEKGGSSFGDGFKSAAMTGFKALAVAATAALAGAVVILKQGVDAAVEQENALNDLNSALARTGQYSQAASDDFNTFASSLQSASIFADDQILSNAALIQSLGKLSTEGLKQATQASIDLASALNIDLGTAAKMVGKAASGEIGTFGRYGIVIKEGATNAETFANALAKINDQFGGAAAAKLNTFSGATTQLKLAFGDLLEEIGNIIIKSPEMIAAVKFIASGVVAATSAIKEFAGENGLRGILITAVDIASFFTGVLGPVVDVIVNLFLGLGAAIGGVAAALVQFVQGDFRAALSTLTTVATENFTAVTTLFETKGTDAAQGFLTGLKTAIETAPPLTSTIQNKIDPVIESTKLSMLSLGEAIAKGFRATEVTVESLANTFKTQLGGGIANAFAAVGSALAKGENGFSAFAKSALGVIGDIAIQMGTVLIAAGLGWSFIPGFQASSAAIPQGIALAVIGGALKAFAGGGGGAPTPSASSSSGGSAGAAPVGTSTSNLQDAESRDPTTGVTVNIDGNVFDNRETGLEIARVINESFATGGIVLARGAVV